MAYQKAVIQVEGERKDSIADRIYVMFNPAEYNLTDGANYAQKQIPGVNGPVTQFISGEASTLKISLIFDTYETSPDTAGANVARKLDTKKTVKPTDVTKLTSKIVNLTAIDGKLHRPPICRFIWGSLHFRGVITDVQSHYTMFTESGMPVRARLEVTFKSVTDIAQSKKQSPFESPDRTKYRTLEQGTQLWHIAQQEYGDPSLWRMIADANNIDDIRRIAPGTMLKIPALL